MKSSLNHILAQLKVAESKMLIQGFELHRKPGIQTPTVYLHIALNSNTTPHQVNKLAEYFIAHGHTVSLKSEYEHIMIVALHYSSYRYNSGNLCSNP